MEINIETLEQAASTLRALAHPMRIAILNLMEDGKRLTVTEIHEKLQIDQSAASHHLGILKGKGVLNSKRDGKKTYYFLQNEGMLKIFDCLDRCNLR